MDGHSTMDTGDCSAAMVTSAKRMIRGHHPARAILFDLSHPVEIQVWHQVLSAMQDLLSLVCNMSGPPRIPLISIYVLDGYPEVLLPFSPPKGNLCRLLSALRDVRTYMEDKQVSGTVDRGAGNNCMDLGLVESCGQYKRHLNAMGQLQSGGGIAQMEQLEVVVLSGVDANTARASLDYQITQLDLNLLKRLVVCVLTPNPQEDTDSLHSSNSIARDTDSSMVDIVHLETDRSSLQKFFYTWLLETSSDSEHVHLLLPSAFSENRDLVLKCDIMERIINPVQLPHHEFFNLHSDSAHSKTVFPCPSKAAGLTVPVHVLKVIGTLPVHSLCDSLTFGLPLLVQATSCWRIDWEDLEENTTTFNALTSQLHLKNQALLVQLQQQQKNPATKNQQAASNTPKGMFVLLPPPYGCGSLLLKAVATREVLLPCSWAAASVTSTDGEGDREGSDGALRVQSYLTQVPELSTYNPLSYSSGLLEVLLSQAAPKQQAVRPRPATKRKAPTTKDARETTLEGATWSEMSSHVTAGPGRKQMKASKPEVIPRGEYSETLVVRGDLLGLFSASSSSTSVSAGRNGVISTRLPDGFLVDLE